MTHFFPRAGAAVGCAPRAEVLRAPARAVAGLADLDFAAAEAALAGRAAAAEAALAGRAATLALPTADRLRRTLFFDTGMELSPFLKMHSLVGCPARFCKPGANHADRIARLCATFCANALNICAASD